MYGAGGTGRRRLSPLCLQYTWHATPTMFRPRTSSLPLPLAGRETGEIPVMLGNTPCMRGAWAIAATQLQGGRRERGQEHRMSREAHIILGWWDTPLGASKMEEQRPRSGPRACLPREGWVGHPGTQEGGSQLSQEADLT